jgi:hypothetical protein
MLIASCSIFFSIETSSRVLFNGTIMTLLGTFISGTSKKNLIFFTCYLFVYLLWWLACIYVYADNILSKNNKIQPLPARVCCWLGVYTSIFTWIWISVYTLPQFNDIIHVDPDVCTLHVVAVYALVTMANALHSWSYYELIERTGNVSICFTLSRNFI